jgi:hypothetical protein
VEPRSTQRSNAVLVYLLVLITLQVFLLVVAVEGFLGDEDHLAWTAAGFSLVLFCAGLGFVRFLSDD